MINNLLILASLAQGICSSIRFPPLLMARFFFVLLLPTVLLATPLTAHAYDCSAQTEIPEAECEALIAFYNSTNGDNWIDNSGWLTDPIASWEGVTIANGHVQELIFVENALSGHIPPELGNLVNLKTLFFWLNDLSGTIPPELGNLVNLEHLDLADNTLTGNIPPELGALSSLNKLSLNDNDLTGNIPLELGDLLQLEHLDLGLNDLTGSIPPVLANLVNLQILSLANNDLSGNIPPQLGNLSNLEQLRLEENSLENIPPELGNLTNLLALYLFDNPLSGSIPAELGNLSNLVHLFLFDTNLSGNLPPELGNLSDLEWLALSNTDLSGSIPLSFTNLSSLFRFHYEGTNLCEPSDPTFQAWLNNISSLKGTGLACPINCATQNEVPQIECEALVAFYNSTDGDNWANNDDWLTDPISSWHGIAISGGHVQELNLSWNALNGNLPPEIGNLGELKELSMSQNSLNGAIPATLGNLSNLQNLSFRGNNLTGSIPSTLGGLFQLELLDLGGNELTGSIPTELSDLADLKYLILSGNSLSGNIPAFLGNLTTLMQLRIEKNEFSGTIPPELGNLVNLEALFLERTSLSGNLPPELGNLSNLTHLHLFETDLEGRIPVSFTNLPLQRFWFEDTNLCEPSDPTIQAWLNGIQDLEGTGLACPVNCAVQTRIPELECEALVALYNTTDGDNWNDNSGWITEATSWHGVDVEDGHVAGLYLTSNGLMGAIPSAIENLTMLEELQLDENSLSGPIPAELSSLANLKELRLDTNNLTGPVPSELGNMLQLERLLLNNNTFTGEIPLSFINLSLDWFHFNDTNLCEPQDPDFQAWLDGIGFLLSTEVACEIIQPVLTITSQNPDSGVDITVSPADINDEANGSTAFTRTYDLGTPVTLTAPDVAPGGNIFAGWLLDGQTFPDNPLHVNMGGDHTATALFETPTCTLTVASEDPAVDVLISVSLADLDGFGDGTTPFSRTYVCGTEVTLTAPPEAGSNVFTRWLLDNSPETNTQALTVTVDANRATTAVYGLAPRILTVNSQNPESGVEISVSPSATNGLADGTTAFTRTYDDGTNVTLTAPEMAPNGNPFTEWQLDGTTATTNLSLLVAMNASHTATAVYGSPSYTVNVGSQNPDAGVPIMVSPADENSDGDGLTAFSRTYLSGTPINLTAPDTSPEGNPFGKWACGATETMEATVAFSVRSNATCTAYFLIPPDGGSTETDIGETVSLSWSAIPGADRYHVQVSDGPSFGKLEALVVDTDTVTTNRFDVPPGLLSSEQNFFWRIRSGITGETTTRWSGWSDQSVIPTVVERLDDTIPSSFTLENYPNPFNPSTTIRYSLPEAGDVTLVVFDATGRHVVTLVNGAQPAGLYEATFEAGDLPSGTYFFRLEQGTYRETRAMLLVK